MSRFPNDGRYGAKCPGVWVQRRNECPCKYCVLIEKSRWEWINKLERVNELRTRQAPKAAIDRAEQERNYASLMLTYAYMAPLDA
jgi:hypothetical protein